MLVVARTQLALPSFPLAVLSLPLAVEPSFPLAYEIFFRSLLSVCVLIKFRALTRP
jgi:hypothetical protein